MTKTKIMQIAIGVLFVLYAYNWISSDIAEKVIAEEITGVVVEEKTGKPVANAIVAIRFERYNTGHGSPSCFRAVATESDENGRYRFEPWTQEKTLANSFLGEIIAYKKGYGISRQNPEYIRHEPRELLGIRYRNTLHLPKTERKVVVKEWAGVEEDRMDSLIKTVGDFNCGPTEQNNAKLLALAIRNEILVSPLAKIRSRDSSFTPLRWINEYVEKH